MLIDTIVLNSLISTGSILKLSRYLDSLVNFKWIDKEKMKKEIKNFSQ